MPYRNSDGSFVDKGLADILRWKLGFADSPKDTPRFFDEEARSTKRAPSVDNDGTSLVGAARSGLTWIGHASFLLQLGGSSILVDPVFSPRLLAIKRLVAPGISLEKLPKVDVVLVTHNHRDHMDAPSLEALERKVKVVVPKGLGPWFRRRGFGEVSELDWWEHFDLRDLRVTFVPSQHWSQRGPFDRNESLWGGFVLEDGVHRVYHSGDTAYFDGFTRIGSRNGRIDAAMLPIGAYEPRWFMRQQHMNPEDAVRAFMDLGARRMVAMHWGTFKLTDEPVGEPPAFARSEWARHTLEPERLMIPAVGETVWL